MSYQKSNLNNLNNPYNNKINNINLISIDKSPNPKMNNINNQENNNPNNSNIMQNNDLLKSKTEENSNFSNINIDNEQKAKKNVDDLFGNSDDENDISKQNVHSIYDNNDTFTSNDISINERKRIEVANNLFDRSLTMSINSNINNNDISNYSINTINYETRKEAADKLFQTQSEISSQIENPNLNLNISIKSDKTDMSHVINNLTGSNIGLNINALANKFADGDKLIHESIHSNETEIIKEKSHREDEENINKIEDVEEGIQFNKNLIEFKNKTDHDNLNDLNNLKNIGNSQTRNKNKNSGSTLKNALIESNKKNNKKNNKISIINISDNNINNMEENTEKKEESKINKNNIIDESSIRESNIKENNENDKTKNIVGLNFKKLFFNKKKSKNNNENNINNNRVYIEENLSEEQRSKENLIKTKFKNNKTKKESKIFDENNDESISVKEDKDITRKSELIKEKEKLSSILNKERKDTNNDSNNLISDKSNLLKGRNLLSKENEINNQKCIQIQIKKKDNKNISIEENRISAIDKENTNINNTISLEEEKHIVFLSDPDLKKEKRFKYFLKENKKYFNDKICNKKENEAHMKEIKSNLFYPNIIFEKDTFLDEIIKEQKNKKGEIIIYYHIMKDNYDQNKANFNLIFQSVSIENKEKVYKLYKNFENYNIINKYISPHLNDTKSFINTFQLKLKKNFLKNIDYIRYSLDENHGDTFYRCFIFNLFEKKIINKDKEYIYMIIFDIFKIYDLAPDIFSNEDNDINNVLVFFDILRDYIELNQWDKTYEFFSGFFSQINKILIKYVKYNIFLLLSKLYSLNEDIKSYNNDIYLNQYQKILIDYNEPSKIIFQLITIIFGLNVEIIYLENKEENIITEQSYLYDYSKLSKIDDNNTTDKIIILYYNGCYHIGYKKKDLQSNNELFNSMKENINEISLVQYSKKGKIKCDTCKKTTDFIEIINEHNNKGICSECLYKEIDQYLQKRVEYIKDDIKKNYLNYSYYLRPIELFLTEPLSVKNGIENNSIIIKNIDYYLLYQITFSQKIKELLLLPQEESSNIIINNIININSNNNRENKINTDENDTCLMCSKDSNILISSCGCKFCDDCIFNIIDSITDNQIILNGYEKKQLSEQNLDVCPICQQKISLSYLLILLQSQGRNFENENEEAITRMINYCNTICFNCEKKFENENDIEVEHNKKKIMIKLNVIINKHCLKEAKKNKINSENYENEFENGIDYCETQHRLCVPCYKKIKIKRIKEINKENYKVVGCNICGVNHLISEKEWNKSMKNDVCCKCNIF